MTDMEDWKSKRKKWKKARDDEKVAEGEVSGVSIGDAIDKVYSASKKGYIALHKAVQKLEKELNTYVAKVPKANKENGPRFAKWIKSNLLKEVSDLAADVASDLKVLDKSEDLKKQVVPFCRGLTEVDPTRVGDRMKTVKALPKYATLSEDELFVMARKIENVHKLETIAKEFRAYSKQMKDCKFTVTLRGKKAEYETFSSRLLAEAVPLIEKCVECRDNASLQVAWRGVQRKLGGGEMLLFWDDQKKVVLGLRGR